MGVLKPYLITVFLLLVIVDIALARYYYRWFRFGRFNRDLKRCNKQRILDKLCPEVPEDDPCANIDCSCNGQCENGVCTCDLGFTGDNCENDPCANIDCSCNGQCENGMCTCDPGFTGENCDSEDVCALPDFCLNGATCEDNECMCANQFVGERCETCTEFSVQSESFFTRTQFQIFTQDPITTSCESVCSSIESCSATAFVAGSCEFFQAPVIAATTLTPSPTQQECILLCQNTENCTLGLFQQDVICLLLDTTIDAVEFNGLDAITIIQEQCNSEA